MAFMPMCAAAHRAVPAHRLRRVVVDDQRDPRWPAIRQIATPSSCGVSTLRLPAPSSPGGPFRCPVVPGRLVLSGGHHWWLRLGFGSTVEVAQHPAGGGGGAARAGRGRGGRGGAPGGFPPPPPPRGGPIPPLGLLSGR